MRLTTAFFGILLACFALIGSLNADNSIYPAVTGSGAVNTGNGTNYVVIGVGQSGVSQSGNYSNRISSLPPVPISVPVAPSGDVGGNVQPIGIANGSVNVSVIGNETKLASSKSAPISPIASIAGLAVLAAGAFREYKWLRAQGI